MSQFFPSIRSDRSPGWWKTNCTHTPAPPRVVCCWIHVCFPNYWCVSRKKNGAGCNSLCSQGDSCWQTSLVAFPRSSCLWASSWWDSQWVCLTRDKHHQSACLDMQMWSQGMGKQWGCFEAWTPLQTHLMTQNDPQTDSKKVELLLDGSNTLYLSKSALLMYNIILNWQLFSLIDTFYETKIANWKKTSIESQ